MSRFYLSIFILTGILCGCLQVAAGETRVVTAVVLRHLAPTYQLDWLGRPSGFAVQVLESVARQAGFAVGYEVVENWEEALTTLRQGKADLIPAIALQDEFRKEFFVSEAVEVVPVGCVARLASPLRACRQEQFAELRVGVIRHGFAHVRLQPLRSLVVTTNLEVAWHKLLRNEIDLLVAAMPVLAHQLETSGAENHLKLLDLPVFEMQRVMVVGRQAADFQQAVAPLLHRFLESQAYHDLYQKWYSNPGFWTTRRIGLWMALVLVGLTGMAMGWRFHFMRRMNRTLEEQVHKLHAADVALREQTFLLDRANRTLMEEVHSRRQTERALSATKNDLELQVQCVNRMQSRFIDEVDAGVFFHELLLELLKFTNSQFGFIAEVERQDADEPMLQILAIASMDGDHAYKEFFDKTEGAAFKHLRGLYGEPVLAGTVVIANDPDYDRCGLPAGHPPLQAFLGLPLLRGTQVIGVLGMANRPGGYNQEVVDYLQSVLVSCAQIMAGFKHKRRRERAEQALRESEVRYRTLFEAGPDAILLSDPVTGIILDANPAATRLLGLHLDQLRERHRGGIFAPEALTATIMADAEHPSPRMGECRELMESSVLHADGHVIDVEVASTMIQVAGRRVWQDIFRDVTVRKRLAEALQHAKDVAESSNRAKSYFLAAMSHDIRTPMNAILGMSELLLDSPLDPEQKHFLQVQQRAGEHLLCLINDILDLSKIEAGELELSCLPMDPRQVARETLDLFQILARERHVQLALALAPELPARVLGDAQRLSQVLINLLGNAVKFTEQGRVLLALTPVDRETLLFKVSDTGIGIAPQRLETIFQPFIQGHAHTNQQYGGTGLGLTICRQLVERMGGYMEVTSQLGQGSTFQFTARLPAVASVQTESATVDGNSQGMPASPVLTGLNILLVDDSEDNRLLIHAFLTRDGHQVVMAGDGQEALNQFQPGRFNLVLMDIQMPVMDGYAAARCLRQIEALSDKPATPLVALTAYATPEDTLMARQAGFDHHLGKPFRKRQLLELIQNIVLNTR